MTNIYDTIRSFASSIYTVFGLHQEHPPHSNFEIIARDGGIIIGRIIQLIPEIALMSTGIGSIPGIMHATVTSVELIEDLTIMAHDVKTIGNGYNLLNDAE